MLLRGKHLVGLVLGLTDFARVTRAWWIPALVLMVAFGVVAATTTQIVVPTAVYTLI